jgi:hypothetical protein
MPPGKNFCFVKEAMPFTRLSHNISFTELILTPIPIAQEQSDPANGQVCLNHYPFAI